jgi:hypothetical protein
MEDDVVAPNRLEEERLAAGIPTREDLAALAGIDVDHYSLMEAGRLLPTREEFDRLNHALGDIPPSRLYGAVMRQLLNVDGNLAGDADVKAVFKRVMKGGRLFVGKDEVTWLEGQLPSEAEADAYLSMSCGFYAVPHLMLDAVAVAKALGVKFVAVGGTAACCGKPMIGKGKQAEAERFLQHKESRAVAVGVKTRVNFCTADQGLYDIRAARTSLVDGKERPVRDVWFLDFFAERLRELGDEVPWKKEVRCRVLAEGHQSVGPANSDAQYATGRLLELVPGAEVIGLYDGDSDESPCTRGDALQKAGRPKLPQTAEEVRQRRSLLADIANARGADTIACQHQYCHEIWGRLASDRMAVRHGVSILAEALGCAHPDRQQAASWLGDPREIVEQTRPNWTSWRMSEGQAMELAEQVADPNYAAGVSQCSCGHEGGGCAENLISIDVLAGRAEPARQ